jgi:hypothetical protein
MQNKSATNQNKDAEPDRLHEGIGRAISPGTQTRPARMLRRDPTCNGAIVHRRVQTLVMQRRLARLVPRFAYQVGENKVNVLAKTLATFAAKPVTFRIAGK